MPNFIRPMHNDVSEDQSAVEVGVALGSVGKDKAESEVEMRNPATVLRPTAPTKAQLEEHLPLHLNYRSWCRHCVSGKAHATRHKSDDEK